MDGTDQHLQLQVYDGFHYSACGERDVNLEALKRHYSNQNSRRDVWPAAARDRPRLSDIDHLIEYVYLQT